MDGAINYYIYRDTSVITTMTGKTPIATVGTTNNYQDTVSVDVTYYYVIVSSNGRGKSWISNCQSVIVMIDTLIGTPTGLNATPGGWTTVNFFNLTWVNPTDKSGIAGVYYKLDSAPVSDTDGTYIAGADINEITGIKVSGDGNHTIYIWLKDAVGNIDFTKNTFCYLCLKILSNLSDDGGDDGDGKTKEENAIIVLSLIIIGIASTVTIIGIAIFIVKKRRFLKREILKNN